MDKILVALSDKKRQELISILMQNDRSVTELMAITGQKQSTLSGHLAILRKSELVKVVTNNKWRIYSINQEKVNRFVIEINRFFNFVEKTLSSELILRKKVY